MLLLHDCVSLKGLEQSCTSMLRVLIHTVPVPDTQASWNANVWAHPYTPITVVHHVMYIGNIRTWTYVGLGIC